MLDSGQVAGGAKVPIKFQFSFDRNGLAYLRSAVGNVILYEEGGSL